MFWPTANDMAFTSLNVSRVCQKPPDVPGFRQSRELAPFALHEIIAQKPVSVIFRF
jgi:hypothetical protein